MHTIHAFAIFVLLFCFQMAFSVFLASALNSPGILLFCSGTFNQIAKRG